MSGLLEGKVSLITGAGAGIGAAVAKRFAAEGIVEPIFVIGPPRSGTTVLHRHLGAVAGHRVARGWEFTRPLPPPDPETYDHDPRILETADELEFPQAVATGLGAHKYQPADFGLNSADMTRSFERYRTRFFN